jgi:hypothetical protein
LVDSSDPTYKKRSRIASLDIAVEYIETCEIRRI